MLSVPRTRKINKKKQRKKESEEIRAKPPFSRFLSFSMATEAFLEALFHDLRISASLPTLESMQRRLAEFSHVIKTGENPEDVPVPTTLSLNSIGVPVSVAGANGRLVLAVLKFDRTGGAALSYHFNNREYDALYDDKMPFQTTRSIFAKLLTMYIASTPKEQQGEVHRRSVAFVKAKHEALGLPLEGFVSEQRMDEVANDLDSLASAVF